MMDHPAAHNEPDRRRAFDRSVLPELGVLLHATPTMTRAEADAEDLVQDTLLGAFRGIDRFDGKHVRACCSRSCAMRR
jgi:RNA polymerase sigma-70 factor (ECF subfamily)